MESLKQAIAQIKVGSSRGTGFLVSEDGLVLTALHVIANREMGIKQRKLVTYPGEIRLRFGDPKNDATWAPASPATIEPGQYSIEDDWVLLRIAPPVQARPLPLARLAPPQKDRAFETFGFPDQEADIGGSYGGTIIDWDGKSELTSPQILVGAPMGGISGAPCVVDGQVVAMIVQALLDEQRRAVKPSLYAVTIERAARGGRLAWDEAATLPFQAQVQNRLPTDAGALAAAARRLGLPEAQAQAVNVARRLLRSRLAPATDALGCCGVEPKSAERVMEYVAAMQLQHEAVARLSDAAARLAPALLRAKEDRVAHWYVRRARYEQMGADHWVNRTVVVSSRAGGEEPVAGEHDPGQAAAALVGAIGDAVRRRWPDRNHERAVKGRLSSKPTPEAEFCVVLHNELRFDVVDAVRARLPNAHLVVLTAEEVVLRDEDLTHITHITPVMTPDDEEKLLTEWELSQTSLQEQQEPP
jgi:hypothetical protein